ncbi:MAG TPA: TIM barrel protein [Gammaproteobacteria bacterium]|nr:TIM barrel protein [Gammaproteobacteria bacterium]
MKRREFMGAIAAAGLVSSIAAEAQQQQQAQTQRERQDPISALPQVKRRGRIKQGLWRNVFGDQTKLSFDEMCQVAARLGCYGFDMIRQSDWPTLRKHGLEPLLVGTGGVDFKNGLIHPEVHDKIEASLRPYIDMVADNGIKRIISVGGQRRGMPFDEAADNAVSFLNRIKGQLEKRGVTLAVENMNNRRTDPRYGRADQVFGHWDWGIGVCERVNSPNVKIVCDLYHLQIMDGDIAQRLRDSIQWIAHFHTAGVPSRNEIDYTQEVNYHYVAEVIASLGFDGYVSHEWRPAPGRDPFVSIQEALSIMDV